MKNNFVVAIASIAAAAALSIASFAAQAQTTQEGQWLVRLRAVNLDSANGGSTTPNLALSVNNKVIPELDISYFFTPNFAAELVLTYPQKHDLSSNGTKIGTLKHLPPTLSAQYHFMPTGTVRPYVGLGINYTDFSSVNFNPAVVTALNPSIDSDSWGLSVQVGADIEIAKNIFLNLDVKKVQLGTDVYSNGKKIGDFKVDPLLIGVGLGMRF
ncbi:OmpW/AlkL family protein [Roseateles sp.]|uniref:OmpW/AlkL family protein n=1 Tax=Roseateles sp. TaxID=1971397 RepID=UPI00286D2562|nr:OmpW family outer membrane protein [Roseateles sp.]